MADEKPTYTLYRSRPRLFTKGSGNGARDGLDDLRGGIPRPDDPGKRRLRDRFTFWRVLGYVGAARDRLAAALAAAVPASPPRSSARSVTDAAGGALKDSGFTLTSPNTILVLGSDARTKGSKEPGANDRRPSRSDTIMLMRAGGGKSARLSIPRDTFVDIPGHGRDKINAAYAFGGPGLAIKTV